MAIFLGLNEDNLKPNSVIRVRNEGQKCEGNKGSHSFFG